MIRWPWKRSRNQDVLAVSWSGETLAFVRGRRRADGVVDVRQCGVEHKGDEDLESLVRRLSSLGLKGYEVHGMLRPEQYQVLQIDAPAVPPEEMRSAARWQIKEMLDVHVDDITLDVMRVGDGQQKSGNNLFVVVATNVVVRSLLDLSEALQWTTPVIDIQDMAQRNLQTALARVDGKVERATAALVMADARQAVLTISAGEELFYTRRLDLPEGFWEGSLDATEAMVEGAGSDGAEGQEYVPDYNVGGVSYGTDYSNSYTPARAGSSDADHDRTQRFLVEVQRSLDLWDRTWSNLPLASVRVYAGSRSEELARWLSRELGQTVLAMNVDAMFPGFREKVGVDEDLCWPLLGLLMRDDQGRPA